MVAVGPMPGRTPTRVPEDADEAPEDVLRREGGLEPRARLSTSSISASDPWNRGPRIGTGTCSATANTRRLMAVGAIAIPTAASGRVSRLANAARRR